MRILLIKAPYRDVYGPIKVAAGNYFLLGLGYIASYLRKHGHEVFMLDPEAQGFTLPASAEKIKAVAPDLIGISATSPDFHNALKIAALARQNSRAFLILGGAHGSSAPEHIISKYSGIFDAVCIGEGEQTSLEICSFLEGKISSLEHIDGICFKKDGRIIRTRPRQFIADLDSLPLPARDLIDIRLYKPHAFNTRKGRTATIITSRGCPFKCSFCASKLTLGGVFRTRSPENILEELMHLAQRYRINHLLIHDDTFTYNMDRAKDVCRRIIDSKLRLEWFCFSQVTKVDDELLGLMKKAGCYCIGFGIESVDPQVLKAIHKPINKEISEKAIRMAKRHGIRVQAYFIFGNRCDTKETAEATIRFACKASPTLAFFNKLVAYPGTEIFNDYFGGDYDAINWNDFVPMGVKASASTGDLSKAELEKLVYKANMKFYCRPSQLMAILKSIKSIYEFKAYLRGGLGLILQMIKWNKQVKSRGMEK